VNTSSATLAPESFWKYRWLIYEMVSSDLKSRYRRSALGFAWTLLNPILYMAVYSLVFSIYMKAGIDGYVVFVMAGLLPWLWFSGAVTEGTAAIVSGSAFLRGTKFPAIVLTLVPVISHLMNMLFSLPILFVLMAFHHRTPPLSLVALPLVVLPQVLLTIGITSITGTYNVFFRDLQQLIAHFLTLVMFAHPIMYPYDLMPASVQPYVEWGPLTFLMRAYQRIFYEGGFPDFGKLGLLTLFSVGLLAVGRGILRRHEDFFADSL